MRRNIVPLKRGDARHTLLVRLGVRRRARAVLADTLRAALPIRLFAPARGIQHLGMVRIALLDRSEVANPGVEYSGSSANIFSMNMLISFMAFIAALAMWFAARKITLK